MKVKDLIQELKKLPEDAEIMVGEFDQVRELGMEPAAGFEILAVNNDKGLCMTEPSWDLLRKEIIKDGERDPGPFPGINAYVINGR